MPDEICSCYLAGSESLLIHCAEAWLDRGHVVRGIITATPQLVSWAEERGLPVIAPGKELAARLTEPFDYFFSITNLTMIPGEVIAKARKAAINFHDGPLPRYAGLYATAWAVLHREESHGITWHAMTDDVDAGAVYHQTTFELGPEETSYTLNTRCYEAAIESFGPLVDALTSGRAEPRLQPPAEKHYFARHKRPEAAGTLRWDRTAADLEAVVRALDFGPVENPLTLAKILAGDELVAVKSAARVDGSGAPGTILTLDDEIVIACSEGALAVRELTCPSGSPVVIADWAARHGLRVGSVLPRISDDEATRLTALHEDLCRYESFWTKRLAALVPLELPLVDPALLGDGSVRASFAIPEAARSLGSDAVVAALLAYLGRVCDAEQFDVGFGDPALRQRIADGPRWVSHHVPLRADVAMDAGFDALVASVGAELERVRTRGTYPRDTIARHPQLAANAQAIASALGRVTIDVAASVADYTPPANAALAVALGQDGEMVWCADARVLGSATIASMQRQFGIFLAGVAGSSATPIGAQPLLSEDERKRIVSDVNATAVDFRRDACVHQLFEEQAARTPNAPAVCYLEQTLSYAELDARANQLAHRLVALGVGPDSLVAVSVERSAEMLVATLGVIKAGGAYVPLDPTYPRDRLALMLEDSGAKVLVTQRELADRFLAFAGTKLLVSDVSDAPKTKPETKVASSNLAYVIYTSGSTGKPKGVMVEHRNVVNFFAGMDERLEHKDAGAWLAVTSLSFDISVLELFWTLTRGFKVVVHSDKADDAALARAHLPNQALPITMSLMYFASDEGENKASDKYKLLLEGARFADENGFSAVWTPERHFHAFGGLYPNPSVAAAALATITKNIHLRAASVVMPLHHPIRVAEEWALVDNLSGGRVGISFASGWQPNDFVIYKPERFKDRKQAMLDDLDTVRKLWRGEALKVTSPIGKEIEVRTLPRPIQKELPFWLTAAGNPETFRAAGEIGANLLTHLLGQTIEEVGEKIRVYREARKAAGHEGPGEVTVMLHTFVGPDADEVRRVVREPMKAYLKSSVDLIKAAAWTFPTFKEKADKTGKTPAQIFEEQEMSPEELDAVLEHAFNRYYETSGLFGTPASCLKIIDRLKGIGVDDIGCLLDYGVPSAKVLEHLKYLNELKTLATTSADAGADYTLAAQVKRHGVTHLQCTPSQMSMILADEQSRAALRGLSKVMVGGEAFPAALAADLRSATSADILNMYGPTETTIWSSTERVAGDGSAVSLGQPIANTQLYVLDRRRELLPLGMAGELYIGGDGVTRGYFERAELTADRFVDDPFRPGGRLYRTGDLVRRRPDGTLDFLGRMDFQVKIRGYRIELGEIEAQLRKAAGVRDVVALAREDSPGDKRLVAYLIAETGKSIDVDAVKAGARAELPDYMMPSAFVVLPKFPLTPNGKVDRKALPAPEKGSTRTAAAYAPPTEGVETQIAAVWTELLSVERVGLDDNFFDLGGHSLLTVQLQRRLKDVLARPLALTDLFRFPTIRSLAEFLSGDGTSKTMEKSKDRADARRAAMARRSEARDRRPQRR